MSYIDPSLSLLAIVIVSWGVLMAWIYALSVWVRREQDREERREGVKP